MFKPLYYWIIGKELKNEEKKEQKCERVEQNDSVKEKLVTKPDTDGTLRLILHCSELLYCEGFVSGHGTVHQQAHDDDKRLTHAAKASTIK